MHEPLPPGGTVRKLWLGEIGLYRDHLLRLDAESRRNRFGGTVSDAYVSNYVDVSIHLDAVIHTFYIDGKLRGAAELRAVGKMPSREAEVALSVEQPWQSHGVGSVLLEHTLLAARNRGIRFLHMMCLADNRRMQQLARKFEADLSFDLGSVTGAVAAPRPTPLSLIREWMADGTSFTSAVLDAQSRLFKPL
jgi:GNAT superfamily N-acetyltransferase